MFSDLPTYTTKTTLSSEESTASSNESDGRCSSTASEKKRMETSSSSSRSFEKGFGVDGEEFQPSQTNNQKFNSSVFPSKETVDLTHEESCQCCSDMNTTACETVDQNNSKLDLSDTSILDIQEFKPKNTLSASLNASSFVPSKPSGQTGSGLESVDLDNDFTPSTPYVHKFRTEICRNFELYGKCKYGDEVSININSQTKQFSSYSAHLPTEGLE